MHYAGIGSRDLTEDQRQTCRKLGRWYAEQGHILHTGNALGADQAFAEGANRVDPSLVHLHLPWRRYEAYAITKGNVVFSLEDLTSEQLMLCESVARRHHPAYDRLPQGAQKLMQRNTTILFPPELEDNLGVPVEQVLAFPGLKRGGGGTGQGMRIADAYHISCINLCPLGQQKLASLCEQVRVRAS